MGELGVMTRGFVDSVTSVSIFLPETATKQIETEVTESTNPRVITPSSPIAY